MAQIHPMTETAVANEALSFLLLPGITDLDSETSQKGTVLRRHFASVRDTMQAGYPWNFCERYRILNALPSVTPAFRFQYAYALPNVPWCLTARDIDCAHGHMWKVQGRRLVTNLGPTIKLIFTARVTEVPEWSPLFRTAFALGLAAACGELCKDQDIVARVSARADAALQSAYPTDAGEGAADQEPEREIILARY